MRAIITPMVLHCRIVPEVDTFERVKLQLPINNGNKRKFVQVLVKFSTAVSTGEGIQDLGLLGFMGLGLAKGRSTFILPM